MNASAPLNSLIMLGGALKSTGTVQRGHRCFGKVGGTLCFHSTADDPDQTGERDFFDPQTNFRMEDGLKSPIFYHHGLDRFVSVKELGTAILFRDADGAQINPDESAIDLTDPDGRKTFERAERGELSWSSGTVAHLVRKTKIAAKSGRISNHIDYWPLGLDASLTPAPAEPRCFATAIKTILRLSTDQIVDAPEHLAEEIAWLRELLSSVNESNAQREMQALQVDLLKSRLLRSQMDVLGHYLDAPKPIVSLPTYPVAPLSPVEADASASDAMKKYEASEARDDSGKWTSGGGSAEKNPATHAAISAAIAENGGLHPEVEAALRDHANAEPGFLPEHVGPAIEAGHDIYREELHGADHFASAKPSDQKMREIAWEGIATARQQREKSPAPKPAPVAPQRTLLDARNAAYAAVTSARSTRDRIFAAREAALNGARGKAALKARGKAAPAGQWITHNGAHVFIPEMGATADHVFAAGVLHNLSEDGHKELQKQFDKGEIETTAHLNLALAEAKRARRRGFTEAESIREGIAHHGVHGVASHAEKFRAARESEKRIMRAHANKDAIVARQDKQEHFWASGMDVVDYVGTHADGFGDAQEMAKDLGYHQSGWDDQSNNKRREKERKQRARGRRQVQQMADMHVMNGKSVELSGAVSLDEISDLLEELQELIEEIEPAAS